MTHHGIRRTPGPASVETRRNTPTSPVYRDVLHPKIPLTASSIGTGPSTSPASPSLHH